MHVRHHITTSTSTSGSSSSECNAPRSSEGFEILDMQNNHRVRPVSVPVVYMLLRMRIFFVGTLRPPWALHNPPPRRLRFFSSRHCSSLHTTFIICCLLLLLSLLLPLLSLNTIHVGQVLNTCWSARESGSAGARRRRSLQSGRRRRPWTGSRMTCGPLQIDNKQA